MTKYDVTLGDVVKAMLSNILSDDFKLMTKISEKGRGSREPP